MHTNGCYELTDAHDSVECRKLRAVSAFSMLLRCINAEQRSSESHSSHPCRLINLSMVMHNSTGPTRGRHIAEAQNVALDRQERSIISSGLEKRWRRMQEIQIVSHQ